MDNFFEKQSPLTAAKITIFKEYITGYLPKILLTYGRCRISDLFCGAGKNGDKDGSPLILINQIRYILESPVIKNKNPVVEILFNDKQESNVDDLKIHLDQFSDTNIKVVGIKNSNFETVLDEILNLRDKTPKFFFLDPFNYSDVSIEHLRKLMSLDFTEVFLFIPIFHSYRFASHKDFPKKHKTRRFIEQFTTKGIDNYAGIDDFMQSVKQKLKNELGISYVRPVLLDDGTRKNAIFLLTKHLQGMLLMNEIAFKQSHDGKGVSIKSLNDPQGDLFGTHGTTRFEEFIHKLEKVLQENKSMTNEQIVNFSIEEEFLPKHAKEALNIMRSRNSPITVRWGQEIITTKPNKWNIAKKVNKTTVFSYGD